MSEKEKADWYLERVERLLDRGDYKALAEYLNGIHPSDIALFLPNLSREKISSILSLTIFDEDKIAWILSELPSAIRKQIVESLDNSIIASIIEKLDTDDATDIVKDLSDERKEFILRKVDKKTAEDIKKLMDYEEGTAGAITSTEYIAINKDAKVKDVIKEFRRLAECDDIEDVHNVFVIDSEGKLVGIVPIRRLLLVPPNTKIEKIMNKEIISIKVDMDQEEVANIFKKYDLVSAPVIDNNGKLIGRITVDDILDVIEEEATEDMYLMAGVNKDESIYDGVFEAVRRRVPWLLVNLLTASFSASIVNMFQTTIRKYVLLAVFMPIIAGIGGNSGAQTIAVVIRAIALGELRLENALSIIYKQVAKGLLIGMIIGSILGIFSYIYFKNPIFSFIVSISMLLNILIGATIGVVIPVMLKLLKVDLALASNIFVTALTDMSGFLILLGLASMFLHKITI